MNTNAYGFVSVLFSFSEQENVLMSVYQQSLLRIDCQFLGVCSVNVGGEPRVLYGITTDVIKYSITIRIYV